MLLTLAACKNNEVEAPSTEAETTGEIMVTKEQFAKNKFTMDTLKMRNFPQVVTASGMIDVPPQNKALITVVVGAYIKSTDLLEGDTVKKGQALVTLESPEFVQLQQNYLEVFRDLEFLKVEFKRQETLYKEQIGSEKSFSKAKADYESAFAKYNGLKAQLQLLNIHPENVEKGNITSTTTLYAPITGHITRMNVSKGQYVSPSTPILEIVDNDHIHLELTVFEKDIMKVKKGQPIAFTIPESGDETYPAEVHLVGTALDPANRSVKVHGHLDDEENHGFLLGMFVNAEIITSTKELSSLRHDSVVQEEKATALQLVREDDNAYYFKVVHPEIKGSTEGFDAIELSDANNPMIFLGNGAYQLIGSGGE